MIHDLNDYNKEEYQVVMSLKGVWRNSIFVGAMEIMLSQSVS